MFLHTKLCIATTIFLFAFFLEVAYHTQFSYPLVLRVFLCISPCLFILLEGNFRLWSRFALHLYVSNHSSSVKSTLPLSDSQAWAHRAQERLLLCKADFKSRQFRGDVLQWHEVSRLNRSTAPAVSLARTGWAVACVASVLWWQDTASYGLNTNRIISWQSPFIVLLSPW